MKTFLPLFLLAAGNLLQAQVKITAYAVRDNKQVNLYWKNDSGQRFGTIGNLNDWLLHRRQHLVFAMNGGMFSPDMSPVGLFICRGKELHPLNRASTGGNFGLKPNGVFYLTAHGKAVICKTEDFKPADTITYATQSGPMLVIDGAIHPAFTPNSVNLNIRNGVGVLPDGKLVFAISGEPVNFYDFATFFKNLGCKNALYLDGAISQMYCPEKNKFQTDGQFGVIIGVTEQ